MANFGFFQIPDFASFNALAAPLQALGHTVIDETHITDISQLPIGAVDCGIFLGGTGPLSPTSQRLAGQLWTMRQVPILTQTDDSGGIVPIQSANCYGTLFFNETGDVVPVGSDPLTVNWTTGVQQFQGGVNPGILTTRCDILTLVGGTQVLASVSAVGQPWNGMPAYLRLMPSTTQFWIHWHNGIQGDASWAQDLTSWLSANVVPTSTVPTCSPANCPPPNQCDSGMCFAPCTNRTCAPPNTCVNGLCVGPCSPVTCPSPNACVNGICSPPCLPGGKCNPPATCQNGHCVSPCSPANCPAPNQCVGGLCLAPCTPGTTCPNGEPCPTSGFCGVGPGAGGGAWWPYLIAVGLPVLWAGGARLHELGKI